MKDSDGLLPKSEAGYKKDAQGESPCNSCANFISPDACSLVSGAIAPTGTCDMYQAKETEGTAPDPEALMTALFGGA